jgi:hypothetical protein
MGVGPDKHMRFWSRRMVHETAVHRVDGERLRLVATDRPDRWTIVRQPAGFGWTRGEPEGGPSGAAGSVTVRGGVADLYLLLWGRWPDTDARFEVAGDRSLLAHWQRHAVVT